MAKIYYNRLVLGTITYDAIPSRYQAAVKQLCRDAVADGKMTVEEYEQLIKEPYEQ